VKVRGHNFCGYSVPKGLRRHNTVEVLQVVSCRVGGGVSSRIGSLVQRPTRLRNSWLTLMCSIVSLMEPYIGGSTQAEHDSVVLRVQKPSSSNCSNVLWQISPMGLVDPTIYRAEQHSWPYRKRTLYEGKT